MKNKRFNIKESVLQKCIPPQSQYQRHKNKAKYIINISLLPRIQKNKEMKTETLPYDLV